MNIPTKKLSNGVEIPMVGYGVYQIWDQKVCEQSVLDAFETGYRLIDTARVYGNEAAVGNAVKASGIDRKDLFITSKVWTLDIGYAKTKAALHETLDRMQLDYLDLYLIHEPMGDYYGSWRAMQEMYEEGLIRAIGVCNMWPDRMLDLCLNADIKPHLHQMETHPFQQQLLSNAVCGRFNVAHEAWAPFMEGHENIWKNPVLIPIAEAHSRSVAQVILRWLYQRGIVSLSKSVHKERMQENISIFDFELTEDEMNTIRLMDHDRPLILNNRDLEVVERISPRRM